jgi:hypothetical protein
VCFFKNIYKEEMTGQDILIERDLRDGEFKPVVHWLNPRRTCNIMLSYLVSTVLWIIDEY